MIALFRKIYNNKCFDFNNFNDIINVWKVLKNKLKNVSFVVNYQS